MYHIAQTETARVKLLYNIHQQYANIRNLLDFIQQNMYNYAYIISRGISE